MILIIGLIITFASVASNNPWGVAAGIIFILFSPLEGEIN